MAFILSPTAAPAPPPHQPPRRQPASTSRAKTARAVLATSWRARSNLPQKKPNPPQPRQPTRRRHGVRRTLKKPMRRTLSTPWRCRLRPLKCGWPGQRCRGTAGTAADVAATETLEPRKAGPALPGANGASIVTSTDAATAGIATALTEPLAAQASLATDKAGKKAAGHTPLQATVAAAGDGIASQIDAPATAEVAEVASAVISAASARGDGQDIRVLSESADASAELAPASAQGNGQAAASAAGTAKLPAAGVPVTPAARCQRSWRSCRQHPCRNHWPRSAPAAKQPCPPKRQRPHCRHPATFLRPLHPMPAPAPYRSAHGTRMTAQARRPPRFKPPMRQPPATLPGRTPRPAPASAPLSP